MSTVQTLISEYKLKRFERFLFQLRLYVKKTFVFSNYYGKLVNIENKYAFLVHVNFQLNPLAMCREVLIFSYNIFSNIFVGGRQKAYIIVKYVRSSVVQSSPDQNDGVRVRHHNTQTDAPSDAPPPTPGATPAHVVTSPPSPPNTTTTSRPFWTVRVDTRRPTVLTAYSVSLSYTP